MGAEQVDTAGPSLRNGRSWAFRLPLFITILALGLRLWAPGPMVVTIDEPHWMWRSVIFKDAIEHGRLADATAAKDAVGTMPGVTTMWAGTAGLKVASAQGLAGHAFTDRAMLVAKSLVALACSLALWATILLASVVVGRRAAAVLGTLMAVEPWLVGHSHLVHTDAMVTMFGFAGFMACAAAASRLLGHLDESDAAHASAEPSTWRNGPKAFGVYAGVLLSLAVLTKLNGLLLVGGSVCTVTVFAAVAAHKRPTSQLGAFIRAWGRVLGWCTVAFACTAIVVWPALLADPLKQFHSLGQSLGLADQPTPGYFRGALHTSPPPAFYPVIVVLRMSPWLLAGSCVSAAAAMWALLFRRRTRLSARWFECSALGTAVVYGLAIAVSTKWYDRYALPLFSFAALAFALGCAAFVEWIKSHSRRYLLTLRVAGWATVAVLTIITATNAPYATAYVDPLVGGQTRAANQIRLGWGEGVDQVDRIVNEATGGHCDKARVGVSFAYSFPVHCGDVDLAWQQNIPDFVVEYISDRQQLGAGRMLGRLQPFASVAGTAKVDGFTYVWVWRIDTKAAQAALG